MGREVSVSFTGDASGAVAAANATLESVKTAGTGIKLFGKEALDAEGLIRLLANTGREDLAEMAQVLMAAEVPVKEVVAALNQANGEIKATATAAKQALETEAKAAKEAADTEAQAAKRVAQEQKEAHEQAKKAQQELAGIYTGTAAAMTAVSAAGAAVVKSSVESAASFEQQRQQLVALYGDVDVANQKFRELVAFSAQSPFTLDKVTEAAAKIKALGANVDELLPLAGNLAARFHRDIPDAAEALAKAMVEGAQVVRELENSFGVSRQKLHEFGAELNNQGELLAHTPEQLAKLHGALMALGKAEWSHGMAEQMQTLDGQVSNLSDSWAQLKASFGENFMAPAKEGVSTLTSALTALNNTSEGTKEVAAGLVVATTAGAATAAGAATLAAIYTGLNTAALALDSTLTAMAVTAAAAIAPFLAVGVAAGALAAYLYEVVKQYHEINEAAAANTKLLTEQSSALVELGKAHHEWAGKSTEQLQAMGVTAKDVSQAVNGIQQEIQLLTSQGVSMSDQRIQRLIAEKQGWREVGEELATVTEREKAAADAAKKHAEELTGALTALKEQAEFGDTAPAKMAVDAQKLADELRKVQGAEKEAAEAQHFASQQRANAAQQTLEDLRSQYELGKITHQELVAGMNAYAQALAQIPGKHRDAQKAAIEAALEQKRVDNERLELAIKNIETEKDAKKRSLAEIAKAYRDLERTTGDPEKRAQLEQRAAQVEAEAARIAGEARRKAIEEVKQAEDRRLHAALDNIETEKRDHLKSLQDIAAEYQKLADSTSNPDKKEDIQKRKKDTLDEVANHEQQQQRELNELKSRELETQEQILRRKMDEAKTVNQVKADEAQLVTLIHARYEAERQAAQAAEAADEAKYGKTAAGTEKLKLLLKQMSEKEKSDTDDVANKRMEMLEKWSQKLDEIKQKQDGLANSAFHAGGMSIQEAFKDSGFGSGIFADQNQPTSDRQGGSVQALQPGQYPVASGNVQRDLQQDRLTAQAKATGFDQQAHSSTGGGEAGASTSPTASDTATHGDGLTATLEAIHQQLVTANDYLASIDKKCDDDSSPHDSNPLYQAALYERSLQTS
ncbi:MAG TPA: hypothetical protein VGO93_04880 [Candidatus Xenobia bacterium]